MFADPLQASHSCHRFFGNCYKPSHLAQFCEDAESFCAGQRKMLVERPRTVRTCCLFEFWIRHALRATTACTCWTTKLHKCSGHEVLLTFSLRNVLHATTACTFWMAPALNGTYRRRPLITPIDRIIKHNIPRGWHIGTKASMWLVGKILFKYIMLT